MTDKGIQNEDIGQAFAMVSEMVAHSIGNRHSNKHGSNVGDGKRFTDPFRIISLYQVFCPIISSSIFYFCALSTQKPMTFRDGNMPTYRQFVFWVAFQSALAMSLVPLAWVAMIVVLAGDFLPSLAEVTAVGAHWLSVAAFGVTWFCILIYQNDRWVEMHRKPAEPQSVPRPLSSRNQSETRRLTSQMALGRNEFFPVFSHHYAALYHKLERNNWKITKRVLRLKVDTVAIFPNIDAKYMAIVKEWDRLGFVDGYVTGEAREKWFLNEVGRAEFAKHGQVRDGSTSPTDDD